MSGLLGYGALVILAAVLVLILYRLATDRSPDARLRMLERLMPPGGDEDIPSPEGSPDRGQAG